MTLANKCLKQSIDFVFWNQTSPIKNLFHNFLKFHINQNPVHIVTTILNSSSIWFLQFMSCRRFKHLPLHTLHAVVFLTCRSMFSLDIICTAFKCYWKCSTWRHIPQSFSTQMTSQWFGPSWLKPLCLCCILPEHNHLACSASDCTLIQWMDWRVI